MNGLVLSGAGGAIGFLGGALSQCMKQREYHKVVGVSSGALTGIMYATDQMDILKEVLFTIEDEDVAKRRIGRYVWRFGTHLLGLRDPLMGIYDNSALRELLKEMLVDATVEVDYMCVSVNAKTNKEIWWQLPKGYHIHESVVDSVVSMIISSTVIPGVFAPEKIGGNKYVDGGVRTHTPIEPIKQLLPNADHLTIISTAGQESDDIENIKSDLDYLPRKLSHLISLVAEIDFLKFEHKNARALLGDSNYRYFPAEIIKPSQTLAPTTRFHYEFMQPDWAHGVEKVKKL